MKAVAAVATGWLKPLAKKTLPDAARLWLRNQLERVLETKQDLYDRILIKQQEFTNREKVWLTSIFAGRLTTNDKASAPCFG